MNTQGFVLLVHLSLTVTPTLSDTQCPFGTERFPGRSDCLSLEDYCSSLNRILSEDGLECGDQCSYHQRPSSDSRSCDQLYCSSNSDKSCLPCPDGKVASEDGLSCLEPKPWGQCKLLGEKTRTLVCKGDYCEQRETSESKQCGDLTTERLDNLIMRIGRLESDKITKDQKITDLEADLEAEKKTKDQRLEASDQKIAVLESDKKTKDQKIAALESNMKAKDQRIADLEADINVRIDDLEAWINENNQRIANLETNKRAKDQEFERKIEDVRNPPFGYFCSYKGQFSASDSVITYDKLLYSSQFGLQGDSPGIDINTGKFVSGISGTWRVDFSLITEPDPGEDIRIYLFKNDEKIPETWFYSSRSSSVSGYDNNTGGRSVLLHLDLGDELHLATTILEDPAYRIIFCVSLEQFDTFQEEVVFGFSASVSN